MKEIEDLEQEKAKEAGISTEQFKKICALYAKYQNKEISSNQMYEFAHKILSVDTLPPIPTTLNTVNNLNDICDMFDNDKESIFSKNANIQKFISFIMSDGKQIKLSDYDEDKMDKPVFLKINSPELSKNGNEIILSLSTDLSISEKQLEWMKYEGNSCKQLLTDDKLVKNDEQMQTDYDGFYKTAKLLQYMKEDKSLNTIPAIEYCKTVKSPVNGYQAYIPASGQLYEIGRMMDIIKYICKKLRIQLYGRISSWSSTETNYKKAVAVNFNHGPMAVEKDSDYYVLPLFKKLN